MRSTLILCAKNGGPRLQTCLDHIERLDAPAGFEVILVDNGSTDGASLPAMMGFAARSRHACRVIECAISGNSAGRNSAIAEAGGDVLLFIDGDCYVAVDFLTQWQAALAAHDVGYASGRIMRFNPEHSMLGCNEDRDARLVAAGAYVPRGFIQGSNMAFTRNCLDRAGLFDARFGAGTRFAGEEWELVLRASQAGCTGGYFPGPSVDHDHGRAGATARERILFYDYGAGAVYAKHLFRRGEVTPCWRGRVGARMLREVGRMIRRDRRRAQCLLQGFMAYAFESGDRP